MLNGAPAGSSTSDLRFSEIARRLESQDKVLEALTNGVSAIRMALADLATANALTLQDRANMREVLSRLNLQQDETQKTVSILRAEVTHQGVAVADHEERLDDFDKLMTRVSIGIILAICIPIALYVLQKLIP